MAGFNQTSPRMLIDKEWIDSPGKRPIIDPYTGETIAEMPQADAALLDYAIRVSAEAFKKTSVQAPFERSAVLHKTAAAIERRKAEFADLIVAEAGKPITLAEGEVARAIATFTAAAEEARRSAGEVLDIDAFASGQNHVGHSRRFPIGVIYGITPFNFPLNLVAHKVAPCIATGNTMLLKPAPRTPLSSLLLADVLLDAGMTPGQINVVACPNELAGKPIADARIKMVSFTGSPAVGWPIKGQAIKQKVTLELGGNAAVIVCEDADLAAAVPLIAAGAFAYAGQSCISVQRVYVHAAVSDRFREMLVTYVKEKIKTGDPRDRAVINGPMIDFAAVSRIGKWVLLAEHAGAKILTGGVPTSGDASRQSNPNHCYLPTILEGVDPKQDISCKEAFGPVMTLDTYTDFPAAIARINASPFGLQAGVFTNDLRRAHQAFERLNVGAVLINQVPTFRVETMPYGGVKDSGFGREGVRYAMEDMTEPRAMIVNLT